MKRGERVPAEGEGCRRHRESRPSYRIFAAGAFGSCSGICVVLIGLILVPAALCADHLLGFRRASRPAVTSGPARSRGAVAVPINESAERGRQRLGAEKEHVIPRVRNLRLGISV